MANFNIKDVSGVSVVEVVSSLTQNDYLSMCSFIKTNYIEKGNVNIVFDCEKVSELPSIAIGVFCSVSRDAKRAGGSCGIVNVTSNIKETLEKIHALKMVPLLNSIAEVKEEI